MKEGWEYKKLEEICSKGSSNISLNKIEDNSGEYNLYGASGLVKGIDFYHQEKSYIGIVKDGSGVGRVDIYPPKSSLVGTMQYIFPKDDCEIGFLKYLLQGLHLESYKTGAAIPHIYFKDYGKSKVPIPPLSEQQHIVEELDLLSSIIEKKKAQLNELDNLAQSLFYEMFGNPISNEKGWDKNVLNEVAKVTSSKRILQSEWQEAGIPFYKVADIVNLINGECVTPLTFIKETTYKELKSNGLVPKANDVLITSRGTIGQCYIVKEHDSFYFQDGMITWLSNINSLISPTFLVALFANDVFSDSLKHSANSSTVAYISIKQLSNMKIPIPPLTLQQQFASKIEAIEHQKELIKQSIKEVETLFNSRMDYYFN